MDKNKRERLEKAGFRIGDYDEFLGLSPVEKEYIEAGGHMTKKKSKPKGLMMTARVVEIAGEGIAFSDGKRPQSFVLYFDEAVEALDVGDMVTVTIVKSEA